jgi:ppGpp synthetase/RelA/SpoT-type nucleotidyltranferase
MASACSPEEWGERFRLQRAEWQRAATQLSDLLRTLCDSADLDTAQFEVRVKEVDSFVGKLLRKPDAYPEPLEQMPDVIGLRVITYYEEDIQKVAEIIRREFDVDEAESGPKAAVLDADRFGYLSAHFVVELRQNRRALPEWTAFAGRRAEIQVRSVLQHAWAAIDHKLRYKTESEIPHDLRRGLFRLSALLEVADREFSRLRDQATAIRSGYDSAIAAGYLDVELVADSLEVYLESEDRGAAWLERAINAGFEPHDEGDTEKEAAMRSHCLALATALGVSTLEHLDEVLVAAVDSGAIETMAGDGESRVLGDTTLFDLVANLLLYKAPYSEELLGAIDSLVWIDEAKDYFRERLRDRPPGD